MVDDVGVDLGLKIEGGVGIDAGGMGGMNGSLRLAHEPLELGLVELVSKVSSI